MLHGLLLAIQLHSIGLDQHHQRLHNVVKFRLQQRKRVRVEKQRLLHQIRLDLSVLHHQIHHINPLHLRIRLSVSRHHLIKENRPRSNLAANRLLDPLLRALRCERAILQLVLHFIKKKNVGSTFSKEQYNKQKK